MATRASLRVCAVSGHPPPSEPRRVSPASTSGRATPGASPLILPSPQSSGVSCSSTAVAGATMAIPERDEFRRGVGLCVVNNNGLVFAAKRMDDTAQTWQMPQGGIDPYENPLVAAVRELREETGMTSVSIVSSIDQWLEYDWPTKARCGWTGQLVKYRGQTQKWFMLRFHGADDEIDISCHGSPEFSEWRWMALEELPHSVVDFKRGVYEAVAGHFGPMVRRLAHGRSN